MSIRRDLSNPDYEPTDEELAGLMRDAFGHLREAREQSLREMRARIAQLQTEALARHRTVTSEPPLDAETFRQLVEEGESLGRRFDADSAPMRILSADDLGVRSR